MSRYAKLAPFYDAIAADYMNYLGAAEGYSHLTRGRRLLDVGGGTGRLAAILAKEGFDMTVLDASPEMVAIGKADPQRTAVDFQVGDLLDLDADEVYDSAISHAGVFVAITTESDVVVESYLRPPEEVHTGLSRIARAIRPEGVFVFDFYPDHDPATRTHTFGDHVYTFSITEIDGMRHFVKNHQVLRGEKLVVRNPTHHFRMGAQEFGDIALDAGFRSLRRVDDAYMVLKK